MAILKTINKSTKTHGAMSNCINYVLKREKTKDRLVYQTGPAPPVISQESVYQFFLEEKKIWDKDSGRMYNHNIISFHQDEAIAPVEALDFGIEFAERWFPDHQTLVSVHQDRDHVHVHLVTNTVSFIDGMKLHNSRADLERMKQLVNDMCLDRGLSIAEKGHHYDGSIMEQGEIIAWNKDKYHLLTRASEKSYVASCGIAFLRSLENSTDRESFMSEMERNGWHTVWRNDRKHITFKDKEGNKVKDTTLSRTFSLNIGKEELQDEFEKKHAERIQRENKLHEYYSELESAITGAEPDSGAVGYDPEAETGDSALDEGSAEEFIRNLGLKERASAEKLIHRINNRKDRDAIRGRLDLSGERGTQERECQTEIRDRGDQEKFFDGDREDQDGLFDEDIEL